jgi:hypothetical protein
MNLTEPAAAPAAVVTSPGKLSMSEPQLLAHPIIDRHRLREIWLEKQWTAGETFHLYVHNPFCLTECTFCKHRGMKTKIGSDIYDTYYRHYLPGLIAHYADVIANHDLCSVYFGGGTSSMMTSEVMADIFSSIPKFDAVPFKTFECNPSLMNEEKIELLASSGFNYVSFGVQTFNTRILQENNRPAVPTERFNRLCDLVAKNSIALNCDLITFIDRKDPADLAQLAKDLDTLADGVRPDVITVYAETHRLRSLAPAEQLRFAGLLRQSLVEFENRSKGRYRIVYKSREDFFSPEAIRQGLYTDYRIYRTDISDPALEAARSYNCSGEHKAPASQNTLGLGSLLGEPDPSYTYLGKDFYCVEVNKNWVPEYRVIWDDRAAARKQ